MICGRIRPFWAPRVPHVCGWKVCHACPVRGQHISSGTIMCASRILMQQIWMKRISLFCPFGQSWDIPQIWHGIPIFERFFVRICQSLWCKCECSQLFLRVCGIVWSIPYPNPFLCNGNLFILQDPSIPSTFLEVYYLASLPTHTRCPK